MNSKHRRHDAQPIIGQEDQEMGQQLHEMRQAAIFGRQSIINRLREQKIEYEPDEPPSEEEGNIEAILECMKQVEQICFFLIDRQSDDPQSNQRGQLLQLRSISRLNQQNMLIAYRGLKQLADGLQNHSQLVMQQNPSLDLLTSYKTIFDCSSLLTETLQKYRSNNSQFGQQKQYWLEQLKAGFEIADPVRHESATIVQETEHGSSEISSRLPIEHHGHKQTMTEEKAVSVISYKDETEQLKIENQELRLEIQELQEMISLNNREFGQEVQKYNAVLYEQQEELKGCQRAIRSLESQLLDIQNQNVLLREQRFKDEVLIENMTRKLRISQREKEYQMGSTLRMGRSISPNSSLRQRLELRSPKARVTGLYQRESGYKLYRSPGLQQQYKH